MKTPAWFADARCRQLGIRVEEFIPSKGQQPTERARAACEECLVSPECAADRGSDIGLRAGVFVGDRGRMIRPCARCHHPIEVRNFEHRYCPTCRRLNERDRKRSA